MGTRTQTFRSTVRLPRRFVFRGNEPGCTVKALYEGVSTKGDGDINTGHGGKVFGQIYAYCKKEGRYARLSFKYYVSTDDYGKKAKGDCLMMETFACVDLGDYDYTPNSWSYVNENNQKVTVQEKLTYTMPTHGDAYYITYKNAKDSRHGWLSVDNDYPDRNKVQSWIPRERIKIKIDDSGNELTKVGNIGFEVVVYITLYVTRTVTTTTEDVVNNTAQLILNRDNALKNPTVDSIVANRPIITFEDGTKNFANMVIHDEGSTGAWLRGTRQAQSGVISYAFPHSPTNYSRSTDYYLGSILLADDKFRTAQPSVVIFSEGERKPLDMFSTISRIGCYYDGVLPTAKEMNNKKNDFLEKYRGKVDLKTELPSITSVTYKDFESTDGISMGGSIKGVDFGFSTAERSKRVRVFEFKQVLFTFALNDTYTKASDFFTSKFDLAAFRKRIQHYSPVIISAVNYGRSAYLAIASDDTSAMSVNISKTDFLSGKANLTGSSKKCTFKAVIIGGTAGSMTGNMNLSDAREAQDFINSLCREMTAVNVEAAVPIEFEAKYLCNMAKKVTTNVLPYFSKYVDQIYINVWENNKGMSASARLRFIDYAYDSKGVKDYVFRYYNKSLDYTVPCSPWACCIEIKVDIVGADGDKDFNIFIPYIPLASLTQDGEGRWVFKVRIGGSTLYDAKNNVVPSVTVPGCYVNKNNKYYRGDLAEGQYKGQCEDKVLADYFNYCEEMTRLVGSFQKISSEKKIKCCRGND